MQTLKINYSKLLNTIRMKYSIIISAYNQKYKFKKILAAWKDQTVQDFEIIVGDDGSSDGLGHYLRNKKVKYYYQEDKGYGFTSVMNEAAKLAEGDYLVFMNGDCFPDTFFLEEMDRVVKEDRVVNGVRMNIIWSTEEEVSADWRLTHTTAQIRSLIDLNVESFCVDNLHEQPWILMTLTTMVMPRKAFKEVGGLTPVYDGGYGKMDWSLAMKAFFSGYHLWYHLPAIVYHQYDKHPREDSEKNTLAFIEELNQWRQKNH
jgi:GT2 family glycosyltransferase